MDIIIMFVAVFSGMGIYEILKAISEKIRKQAFYTELKKFTTSKFLDEKNHEITIKIKRAEDKNISK